MSFACRESRKLVLRSSLKIRERLLREREIMKSTASVIILIAFISIFSFAAAVPSFADQRKAMYDFLDPVMHPMEVINSLASSAQHARIASTEQYARMLNYMNNLQHDWGLVDLNKPFKKEMNMNLNNLNAMLFPSPSTRNALQQINIDVKETEKAYQVLADIPGTSKEDVQLEQQQYVTCIFKSKFNKCKYCER